MKFAPDDYLAFFPLHHEVEDHSPLRLQSRSRAAAKKRRISLALQGGGSFGAFTWGVLDRLLEDETITFDAVSGASAGAVNAVLLASGLAQGGPEAAKESLERFWKRASEAAPRAHAGLAVEVAVRHLSPYQFNPFNLHPLKTLLAEEVDFEALQQSKLKLLVATTRVRDGRLRVFREKAVTLDVILASTCLPVLHHAVSIDGEAYWDGGYSANPPLLPLVSASRATDALVVQIMPSVGAEMPTSASEIRKRIEQITFASSLARDMDALAAMKELAGPHDQGSRLARKLQKLRLHHLSAEAEYPALGEASALNLDWTFLLALRDAGRRAAERWLGHG
ncbi:patatin-like phospholipase family protein (plasmid) [Microvirga sp. RSM25]|uniref:patatin-like phospholipase family protein n=1 Tax=Microvirga sp. RSM25 TaxID=3273802 RepID=UPI00384C6899